MFVGLTFSSVPTPLLFLMEALCVFLPRCLQVCVTEALLTARPPLRGPAGRSDCGCPPVGGGGL